jgi:hypothetical protein
MSFSRAEMTGPFARALWEALENGAGTERAAAVLARALMHSTLASVPEELESFRRFTNGPLRQIVESQLRPSECETIFELVGHVLWMATSDVQSRRADDADDPSGERSVDAAPFRIPSLPPTPVPMRMPTPHPPTARQLYVEPSDEADTSRMLATPRPRPSSNEQPAAATLGRVRRSSAPTGGVVEIGPGESMPDILPRRRTVTLDVLVLTLDPLLVFETDNGLAGRGRVTSIATASELARAASAAQARLVIVVDSALPSIDLPTFAPISGSLPPGTRIVLWGVDERQKSRLAAMFPAAKDWIASGRAASPAEVILDL